MLPDTYNNMSLSVAKTSGCETDYINLYCCFGYIVLTQYWTNFDRFDPGENLDLKRR